MEINTDRNLGALALLFEHLVNDNGNKDVHASLFREISTEDDTFDNNIRIGRVYDYVHSAIVHMVDSRKLVGEKAACAKKALDALQKEHSFQCVVDALNILADGLIIF